MAKIEIQAYLNHLAVNRQVSPSTQSTALNAIVFLYRHVLELAFDDLDQLQRAKRRPSIPVILSANEILSILAQMTGANKLMAELIYGTGMRISECAMLRIKDIDFDNDLIVVRAGKGNKDRVALLPNQLLSPLRRHIVSVASQHNTDLINGNGWVPMPNALHRKYPAASRSLGWQFVFASSVIRPWQKTEQGARWHTSPSTLQRAFSKAVRSAEINKHVGVHTLRHSFASHLLAAGTDIRTIQRLLGHAKLETTMIYTHVDMDIKHVRSPLDLLSPK